MRIRTSSAIVCTCALMAVASTASANHVDFIEDGDYMQNGPSSQIVAGAGSNILGGQRFVGLEQAAGHISGSFSSYRNTGESFLSLTNDPMAASKLTLDYGDFAGGPGPLNSDFDTNWNFIAVNISFVSSGGMGDLMLGVESSAGNGMSAPISVSSPGVYYFSFTDPAYASVNFMDVDRVTMMLTTTVLGSDFHIESITREVVPAPPTIALLASIGLLGHRRKRRPSI